VNAGAKRWAGWQERLSNRREFHMSKTQRLTQGAFLGSCVAVLLTQSMPHRASHAAAASAVGGCPGSACDWAPQKQCPDGNLACGQFLICSSAAQGLGICVPTPYCGNFGCDLVSGSDCLGGSGSSQTRNEGAVVK